MERPIKFKASELLPDINVFVCTHIDPLLDELERLKADKNPFPSLQECLKWWKFQENPSLNDFYTYFSQFCYETKIFPKAGDEYEFGDGDGEWTSPLKLNKFMTIDGARWNNIRPVTTPTREEVIAKLTDEELAVLGVSR